MSDIKKDTAGKAHRGGIFTAGRPWEIPTLGVILVIATGLRIAAARGDLFIDEIWSLDNLAIALTWPTLMNTFSVIFHANTHATTTLYLALVGPEASSLAYRALSVAAGSGMVIAAAAIGWRNSPREGVIAAFLMAFSYPFIHYAGQARGYALMMLAALVGFYFLKSYLENSRPRSAVAFVAVTVVGLSSHLFFVYALLGFGLWAMAVLYREKRSAVPTFASLVKLFGIQFILIESFVIVYLSNLNYAGGATMPAVKALESLMLFSFGVNAYSSSLNLAGSGIVSFILGAVGAGFIWRVFRDKDLSWIFYCVVIFACPVLLILIQILHLSNLEIIMVPRYFLLTPLFGMVLLAGFLSRLFSRGRSARIAAGVFLTLFTVGNTYLLDRFLTLGCCHYSQAVRAMAAATDGAVTISGDQELRIARSLNYYLKAEKVDDRMKFLQYSAAAANPTDWRILESLQSGARFLDTITAHGTVYNLTAKYNHWGLSGSSWGVYRRAEPLTP